MFSRWVFFAGLLVASGLALFDLLVWRPLVKSDLRTGWIAIGLAAVFVSSHGLVHASHGGASTRFGLAIYIGSGVAATGAAAAAIAVTDRRPRRSRLSSRSPCCRCRPLRVMRSIPGRSWLEVPVDLLHVVAAAVWIGGLFALAFVVPREGVSPEVVGAAARRFSSLALASVVVLALTGAVRALAELSAVSQLWTTGYGRAILVKTGALRGAARPRLAVAFAGRRRCRAAAWASSSRKSRSCCWASSRRSRC